ncbi:ATP-binding protein [Dyadobacter sp. CY312]|uniref:ATP-binding protein n=1 Tax=Dyadobacter sp. CY312 TaxID=2907303 RepID=UPI001F2AC280|nr:ATP-binding protein [Dyadobacter sp. CY312]MCE7044659.1 ATP-binding protein [Dyadobacter sp. CY312]
MAIELFSAIPDLKIGRIIEVSGNSLKIELDIRLTELTRSVNGKVYPIGQLGSIIKIHFGRKILFAYVRMLRMKSDVLAEEGKVNILPGDDSRILEADMFGQGVWSKTDMSLQFTRGVETYPLPLQDVFLCLSEEVEKIYGAAEKSAYGTTSDPLVPIGHYIGGNHAICRANIDKLFGHHCAILGSTGYGKSGTVASIIHSVLDHQSNSKSLKPRIIIIDPHDEYSKAFSDRAKVYRAYNEASAASGSATQLHLPYWMMSSDEFRSLVLGKTEFEATTQNNIVYKAITYARMQYCNLVENVGDDPTGGAKDDELAADVTQTQILNFDRDKPVPFLLSEFEKHIDKVQGRKPGCRDYASASDRKSIESILSKLKVLRSNPQLSFMMREYDSSSPKLEDLVAQFVGVDADGKNLRIIDVSGLPNEVAGPLTALIARLLFQYKLWQNKAERVIDPVLFVCEEAHRYVPNHGEAQYKEAQEAVRRIAKEGRKYGLGLMLVSQRPSDVESTVLSQCNSWLILRLTNSSDQEHVAKFLPDSLAGLTKMLSSLTGREALFIGEASALPSRIRINKLSKDKLPDSDDISFVDGWVNDPNDSTKIKSITDRWTNSVVTTSP